MKEDVARYIKSCLECQKVKSNTGEVMRDFPIKDTSLDCPFRVITIDAMGLFPRTEDGCVYLFVIICCFQRWVELVATKTLDAAGYADAILGAVFCRHGLPMMIRSDSGGQFVNQVVSSMMEKLLVRHHRTLPYTPRAYGLLERANAEILKHLRCLCLEFGKAHDNWHELHPVVMCVMNRTVHSVFGFSPHQMLVW